MVGQQCNSLEISNDLRELSAVYRFHLLVLTHESALVSDSIIPASDPIVHVHMMRPCNAFMMLRLRLEQKCPSLHEEVLFRRVYLALSDTC